uniref:IRG-type G domain-containing protein n=1 Tax=Latimeria chalumnae TaxID=7897 RepID=H3B9J2_LATCH
ESVFSKIQERLDNVKNAKLDIAVTGETGTGKSSFINAIRGLDDEDGAAATTGVVDTTMKPTKYPYPNHPNVNLWDLPGIGAQNFKADEYLQQVNFSRYDFFIIITSERCRENPAKLACEIQKMGKKFYFVCSKVDADIDASRKRRKKNFNDEKILEEIRQNCIDYLKKEGVESPRVYLLSSFELHKFDFQDLVETFKIELPRYKRHVFLQALPNISVEILEKKINSLKKMVWLFSFASCAASFIPGAEISSACDIAILILALNIFRHALGLDNESLEKLARRLNKSPSELKSNFKTPHLLSRVQDLEKRKEKAPYIQNFYYIQLRHSQSSEDNITLNNIKSQFEKNRVFTILEPQLQLMTSQPVSSTKSFLSRVSRFLSYSITNRIMEPTKDCEMLSEKEIQDMKAAFEFGGWESVASKIQENLDSIENAKLHIAITGESGSGKSTFVNAIRGVDDEDGEAAETGVVETTMEPTKYPHPKYPNVNLWDLPGIGTPNFKPDEYLQQVNFSQYDFFIIIASERFHITLACEIQKMGKKFYFARSKVDVDIDASSKRRKSTFNEEKILEKIRQNCIECLQKEGVESPRVYLLSSFELEKFDFQSLVETLENELPEHKRHAFLQSLPNISVQILEKKTESMNNIIWLLATASCGIAAIPVPGLSFACDTGMLVKALHTFRSALGLDNESLEKLAEKVHKNPSELKSVMKS